MWRRGAGLGRLAGSYEITYVSCMSTISTDHQASVFLAALALVVGSAGLGAQEVDFGTAEPPAEDEPKPYDPDQPSSSWNDPGTDEEALFLPSGGLLCGAVAPADLDPAFLDTTELPEGATPLEPSDTPFVAGDSCVGATGPVIPLRVSAQNRRYLAFQGNVRVLVGVSADAACHLEIKVGTPPVFNPAFCNPSNYPAQFLDLKTRGLNKVQLWIEIVGELGGGNHPFAFVAPVGATPSYWKLDTKAAAAGSYFERLRSVVAEAKRQGLFVEVVFFAPSTGGPNFPAGPWGGGGRLPNGTGQYVVEKFDSLQHFYSSSLKPALFEAQKRLVRWVVEELWCYDNVYYQIANEPEGLANQPVSTVVGWHRAMAATVIEAERQHVTAGRLVGGHLIGVQPFRIDTAEQLRQDSSIALLNGHYTTITETGSAPKELGAMRLIRACPREPKAFGFNETKISTLPNATGTEMHQNGTLTWGTQEPARAEAWEFFLHGGATLDHWSYNYTDPRAAKARTELGKLRAFLQGLPLKNMQPSSDAPFWINLPKYPTPTTENWEPATQSRKYWAALETINAQTATTGRVFVVYVHHSAPRCKENGADYKDYVENGVQRRGCDPISDPREARKLAVFQGYDARIQRDAYREDVTLKLGSAPGSFRLEWVDPATSLLREPARVILWNPTNGGTCNGGTCRFQSPRYNYDVVLKITQL